MSLNITKEVVKNTPAPLSAELVFEVTFECLTPIPDFVEWKVTHIGAKKDQEGDQVLLEFDMGPLEPGIMQFNIESPPPDYSLIPVDDVLGTTLSIQMLPPF